MKAAEIARRIGVTGERVRQILARIGEPTRVPIIGPGQRVEYMAWHNMIDRCTNVDNIAYHHYGGRGISVCARWLNSFRDFYADMGAKPSPSHTLDRIDNDGNYEPKNCRWATKKEQRNNQRERTPIDDHELDTMVAIWRDRNTYQTQPDACDAVRKLIAPRHASDRTIARWLGRRSKGGGGRPRKGVIELASEFIAEARPKGRKK